MATVKTDVFCLLMQTICPASLIALIVPYNEPNLQLYVNIASTGQLPSGVHLPTCLAEKRFRKHLCLC